MMKCESSCSINSVSGYLRNAKATAAVSKDADAPIFKAAHYDAAGDLLQILPAPRGDCIVLRAGGFYHGATYIDEVLSRWADIAAAKQHATQHQPLARHSCGNRCK